MGKGNFKVDEFIVNESFQRYILQGISEDKEYWENWIKENPEAFDVINSAKEIITFISLRKKSPKHKLLNDQVYERLIQQITLEKNRNHRISSGRYIRYYWYAASLLILFGFYFLLKNTVWNNNSNFTENYLKVIVPEGQRSQLVLPDGTYVWLNSGTELIYPTEFSNTNREVFIEGEAFFKVAHKNGRPFFVRMKDNLVIKVLGTEFNVKCYPDENLIETTLVNGKIKLIKEDNNNRILEEMNLLPNQKAVYQKSKKIIEIARLNPPNEKYNKSLTDKFKEEKNKPANEIELITAWKDDALVFQNETFEEISKKMERWFGMKIEINSSDLKKERFTGKFTNNETIYQVLDIFNRSEPITYSTRNKVILIKKKNINL